jgi:hypothetical protein
VNGTGSEFEDKTEKLLRNECLFKRDKMRTVLPLAAKPGWLHVKFRKSFSLL